MAAIDNYLFVRHLRAEPSSHVIQYKNGKPRRSRRGAAFWFLPLVSAIVEVPVDDRELSFLFHGRSSDFQDVTAQGVMTFRVVEPTVLAERIDFGIDLGSGRHLREPLAQLSGLLTQLAQQFALDFMALTGVRELLAGLGLELVSIRMAAIRPTADLEKALEAPTRERIQQEADEAGFSRRALAVEKERAIAENELQNRIELARREQQLIAERGANERKRASESAEAERIEAEGRSQCAKIEAEAEALRVVEQVRLESERERMNIHRELPPAVIFGLAAQELAGKLQRIEHLSLAPDSFGPLLSNLMRAQTDKLERELGPSELEG
jgi:hypothetical protein